MVRDRDFLKRGDPKKILTHPKLVVINGKTNCLGYSTHSLRNLYKLYGDIIVI
jgi:hypothetical protein